MVETKVPESFRVTSVLVINRVNSRLRWLPVRVQLISLFLFSLNESGIARQFSISVV